MRTVFQEMLEAAWEVGSDKGFPVRSGTRISPITTEKLQTKRGALIPLITSTHYLQPSINSSTSRPGVCSLSS
ncbi:MAG: hypothetical protein M3352_09500 [Bacteroidota bacterium]|nr:hypothetical protein [Bacteroidota bacterium]